jgi:uroporphyrinogen-III synthase
VTAPLAGRRVVVTRAAEQAGSLVTMLRAAGAEVIEVPLIRVEDPGDGGRALRAALDSLDQYEWLIVTSPNGALRVRAAVQARRPGHPHVGAVGPATAAALGRPVDLVPRRHLAEALVEEMPPPRGTRDGEPVPRVLLAQGDRARPVLADGLARAGWTVDTVEAYRTVPVDPAPDLRERALAADALLLASGSAAEAWVRAFGTSAPAAVISIGPVTTRVANDAGLKVHAEAADHSLAGLVDALTAEVGAR